MRKPWRVLIPLLAALPLLAPPAVAQAAPAGCFDPGAKLTVEEQRLTVSMPSGGPAVGPELVREAGFDPFVAGIKQALCSTRTAARADWLVGHAGEDLWRTAVDRAQGHRPRMGTLDRFDDRPLYWTRLELSAALRQWTPSFPLSAARRTDLLTAFDRGSRGLDDLRFPAGAHFRRVLVSGFDPFELDGAGIRTSNPAGASVLQLDGKILATPSGPAVVEAVSFPVVWSYFDQGIVESAFGTALRDRAHRPDVMMTISQGRPGQFDIERWAGDWRGGFPDNLDASSVGPVPAAAGWPQPALQFIETTLPYQQMLAAPAGAYPVNFDLAFCVWPDSTHPGTGTAQCRTDAPRPGEIAASGGGGDYLSNESMYRSNRVRLGLGVSIPGGHLHTPVLGFPAAPGDLTDAAFEARRQAIAAQATTLVTAAATRPGPAPAVTVPADPAPFATVLAVPGTLFGQ